MTPSYISTKVPLSEEQIKTLKETGYDNVVQLSLDSLDDKVLAQTISSQPGYVERMRKTICLLQQYGFKIQIDSILTKYNCDTQSMQQLYDYIHTLDNLVYWEIRVPEYSLYSPKSFVSIKAERASIEHLRTFIEEELKPRPAYPYCSAMTHSTTPYIKEEARSPTSRAAPAVPCRAACLSCQMAR